MHWTEEFRQTIREIAREEIQQDRLNKPHEILKERIENNFTYHAPKPGQQERYQALRDKAKEFALLIVELTPASREQSLALTELEYCSMMANAAIARNE